MRPSSHIVSHIVRIAVLTTSVLSSQTAMAGANGVRLQQANIIRSAISADILGERSIETPRLAIPALRELIRSFNSGGFDRDDALLVVRLAIDLSETDPTMSFRSTLAGVAGQPAIVELMSKCRPGRVDSFPRGGMPAPVDRGPELENQDGFARAYEVAIDKRVREREVCEVRDMFDEHRQRAPRR